MEKRLEANPGIRQKLIIAVWRWFSTAATIIITTTNGEDVAGEKHLPAEAAPSLTECYLFALHRETPVDSSPECVDERLRSLASFPSPNSVRC